MERTGWAIDHHSAELERVTETAWNSNADTGRWSSERTWFDHMGEMKS